MKTVYYSCSVITLAFLLQGFATAATTDISEHASEKKLPEICKKFDYSNPDDIINVTDDITDTYSNNYSLWREFADYYDTTKAPNGRKLAVFFDGTRNDKSDFTNVRKLYLLAIAHACKGNPVIPYYDKGVDAKWFEKLELSGAFGTGASLNIRQAYRFLSQTYRAANKNEKEDEIYIFGFSRGAFTARSLNGFIEFAGLLDGTEMKSDLPVGLQWVTSFERIVKNVYDEYRVEIEVENDLKQKIKDFELADYPEQKFNQVKVQAIGVFDTVPAYRDSDSLEITSAPKNHKLKLYAKKGFHALSLDEQRAQFALARFEKPVHNSDSKEQQLLSEVWFAGVHSDIGGGYSHTWGCKYYWKNGVEHYDGLETIPLNWMIANFKEEHLFPDISPFPECQDGELHDEYFHTDLFRIIDNPLSRKPDPKDVIHESVLKRIQSQKLRVPHPQREPIGQYLPINLKYPVPCSYTIGRTNGVEPTLQPEMMRCMETPIRTSSN